MSACTSSVPPSRRNRRSCSTRSSFTCIVGVHLADLVEEDGAALGDFDQPLLVRVGAGERAAHVAEQLGLEQRLRHGAAVDGDERMLAPQRVEVHRARDQVLAGAGLAGDEHRAVGLGDRLDHPEHVEHRRRCGR